MLARSGHEVAPPARARSIASLPATTSLRSRRQRRSDLQEDSNSSEDDSKSDTGSNEDQSTNGSQTGSQDGSQTGSQDSGQGTDSDTNTGVSHNTSRSGDSGRGSAMTIDDKGASSDSDNNDNKIDDSPGLHPALRKMVGTANNTSTVATATIAAEETGPTYGPVSLAATGNSTSDSTATPHQNTTRTCNTTIPVATVIAPLATVDTVQILHPIIGIAASEPGGTLSALKGPVAPDAPLDQSDAVPTTPLGPGAVPAQGTLFYLVLWIEIQLIHIY